MKTTKIYSYLSDSDLNETLESMTLEERKDLDKKVNQMIDGRSFTCMTDRLLAKDFFIKGYLASACSYLTEEEQSEEIPF